MTIKDFPCKKCGFDVYASIAMGQVVKCVRCGELYDADNIGSNECQKNDTNAQGVAS